jgi:hypothetical protein
VQLAWFKTANIYIGQGLVLLKISHEQTHVFELASTMPIERLLVTCNGLVKAGTNLKITLSNALCSSINVSIPAEIVRKNELQAFLSASAAEQLNASGVSFKCAMDSKNKSLAAAIPSNIFNAIHSWAKEQACSISSIRPMWSVVSQFAECKKTNIKGFVLHEPDGTILIVQTQNNNLQTLSWHGQLSKDIRQANISRALVGFEMLPENIQNFNFSAKPRLDRLNSSAAWAEHWSAE